MAKSGTTNSIIGLAALIVAIVACIVSIIIPEIRRYAGLDKTPMPVVTQQMPTSTHVPPTMQSEPQIVTRQLVSSRTGETFTVTLAPDEIIVGEGFAFSGRGKSATGSCVVYLLRGNGTYEFTVTDGLWSQFRGVQSSEQAEMLLQETTVNMVNNHTARCSEKIVQYVRLP
jgi:hypothetical protein